VDTEQRRAEIARRRHTGLIVGAILALLFGGWPGLCVALLVAAIARFVEIRARDNARIR
jgi:hypothetical protein